MKVIGAYKTHYGPLFLVEDGKGRILFWRDDIRGCTYYPVREGRAACFSQFTIGLHRDHQFKPLMRAATGRFVILGLAAGHQMQPTLVDRDESLIVQFDLAEATKQLAHYDRDGFEDCVDLDHPSEDMAHLPACFEREDVELV